VPAGWTARVAAVDAEPIGRRQQLLAYGLEASAHIRVIQQRPVVVLTIGETEVALEPDLAGLVEVDSIAPVG
jgi:Fe2+ transport system protein FeoA